MVLPEGIRPDFLKLQPRVWLDGFIRRRVQAEGFIDGRYAANGGLGSRNLPGALIDDVAEAVTQAMQIVREGRVKTVADTSFPLTTQTLCVHGDSPQALEILRAVRQALTASGIKLQTPWPTDKCLK